MTERYINRTSAFYQPPPRRMDWMRAHRDGPLTEHEAAEPAGGKALACVVLVCTVAWLAMGGW